MMFGTQCCSFQFDLNITFDDGLPLDNVESFKYLDLWNNHELTFMPQIDYSFNIT